MIDSIEKKILEEIAGLHEIPQGAFSLRKDGESAKVSSTANIEIKPKKDKPGIDVIVKPGTKGESVHVPVVITATGIDDMVYNTFDIGENADVVIVAGCGIHNPGEKKSQHDGIHNFIVRKGARLRYVEKHYGEGKGTGERILNPVTDLIIEEGAYVEMEMVQIRGVDSTKRNTQAKVYKDAHLVITERLLTHGKQFAESNVVVELLGENSTTQLLSRTVAQDNSRQIFYPRVIGKNKCRGHVECDSIIMGDAVVRSIPEIAAHHEDAQLVHEAAIGKIAGEQIIKLMTLGLSASEAEETILQGFLK